MAWLGVQKQQRAATSTAEIVRRSICTTSGMKFTFIVSDTRGGIKGTNLVANNDNDVQSGTVDDSFDCIAIYMFSQRTIIRIMQKC